MNFLLVKSEPVLWSPCLPSDDFRVFIKELFSEVVRIPNDDEATIVRTVRGKIDNALRTDETFASR